MKANIFNIQPFCVQDGPGVRTTVFFKGCNLRCAWCHNPESFSVKPQLKFTQDRCIGCGACFKACENGAHMLENGIHTIDLKRCIGCGRCVQACCAKSLTMVGKAMTVDKVMTQVLADRAYYGKLGGLTVSGGECLLNSDFVYELFTACKSEGITTACDTAGNVDFSIFEQVMPVTDWFLYDVKAVNPVLHKQLTGVDNALILNNLEQLLRQGARVIVRIPCIPGANFDDIKAAVDLFKTHKPELLELLPYHRMGEGKADAFLGQHTAYEVPTDEQMKALSEHFTAHDINTRY